MNSANKNSENSLKRKFRGQNKNQGVYLYVKNLDEIEIQVIPGIHDIEEINSVKVKLDENANSDIISKTLAENLECKITKEKNTYKMELVNKKPIAIYGMTTIMIRLPTSEKQVSNKFIKCIMKVSAQLDTEIMISNATSHYWVYYQKNHLMELEKFFIRSIGDIEKR